MFRSIFCVFEWHACQKEIGFDSVVDLDLLGTLQMKLQRHFKHSIFQIQDVLDLDKLDADVINLLQYFLLSEYVWWEEEITSQVARHLLLLARKEAPTHCCPMTICLHMAPATATTISQISIV
jgi:hypothetical protein